MYVLYVHYRQKVKAMTAMFVARYSNDIEADLKAGFTCWETAETPEELARTTTAQVALEAADIYLDDYDDVVEAMEAAGLDVRQRPDGRWGIFHYDGLAAWALEAATLEEAIEEARRGGLDQEVVFFPEDVVRVVQVEDGLYVLEVTQTYAPNY